MAIRRRVQLSPVPAVNGTDELVPPIGDEVWLSPDGTTRWLESQRLIRRMRPNAHLVPMTPRERREYASEIVSTHTQARTT